MATPIGIVSNVRRGVAGAALFALQVTCALAQQPSLDTMEQRVKPCTACHGEQGRASPEGYYPRIAGKPAGYLYNQLLNFRDGRRHYPMMVYLTQFQQNAYLREIADFFAAQRPKYLPPEPPRENAALLERGRMLAMEGDPSTQVPACRSCHGQRLMGTTPAVPGLLGVSQDYLGGQLGAWRNGVRAALAPDCMAQIAQRLRPEDIQGVTGWLALQTVPDDAVPDDRFEREPPLTCGSISAGDRAP